MEIKLRHPGGTWLTSDVAASLNFAPEIYLLRDVEDIDSNGDGDDHDNSGDDDDYAVFARVLVTMT